MTLPDTPISVVSARTAKRAVTYLVTLPIVGVIVVFGWLQIRRAQRLEDDLRRAQVEREALRADVAMHRARQTLVSECERLETKLRQDLEALRGGR
jgi:hypothetical protein